MRLSLTLSLYIARQFALAFATAPLASSAWYRMFLTLLIVVPATLGLMLLATPLVATLFQYHAFTAFDSRMAGLSVLGLSLGLPAFAMVKVLLPAFYARQDTRTPVRAGVAALVANMVLNVLLLGLLLWLWVPEAVRTHGVLHALEHTPGLQVAMSLASALASYLNLALLARWLWRAGVYAPQPGWLRFLRRLLVASAAMVLVLLLGLHWAPEFTRAGFWTRMSWLLGLVTAGSGTFFVVQWAMGFRPADLRAH